MSFYNDANERAWQAVFGQHYDNQPCNSPCGRPEGITERDGVLTGVLRYEGREINLGGKLVCHQTWAEVAQELHALMCEVWG